MARTLVKTIKASNESISVIGENTAASTNTVIFRYDSIAHDSSTTISYTDSPTLGGYFEVSEAGYYAVGFYNRVSDSSSRSFALVKRVSGDASNITNIDAESNDNILSLGTRASGANAAHNVHWTGYLEAGTRIFTGATPADPTTIDKARFTITKIG